MNSNALQIVRRFNVHPKVVFDAFTNPEAMRVWWTDTTTFDINLTVGGHWKITRTEGEMVFTALGEYLEIESPHHLQYTYSMPQFSPNQDIITIDIAEDEADSCTLTFTESGPDIDEELRELADGSISESEKGWQQAFDLMEKAWKDSQ